ncbi:DUF4363 family protein [Salinibacter sp.]|uniref:DUF4363 family protein n=1 Tax=Salinibacter sp. TaxID=2065818 RepID=UPI0021E92A9E|nr:DUF4363 family protein [Salinibacter sp.]
MISYQLRDLKPNKDSIDPELTVDVHLEFKRQRQFLISGFGELLCADKKISTMVGRTEYEDFSVKSEPSSREYSDGLTLSFCAPLSQRALDHIEESRNNHEREDVDLEIEMYIRVAELSLSGEKDILLQTGEDQVIPGAIIDQSSHRNQKVDVLTSNGGEVLTVENKENTLRHTISSSDWTQEFCPALGVGHFLTFDYRVPENVNSSGNGEDEFEKQLADAIESLEEMQNYIQAGEWNQASQHIRKVAELIRDWEEEIAMLLKHDEIEEEAVDEITDGMHKLFSYASKFAHRKDKSREELIKRSKASKEDAYLAYTIGTAVVNLISAKLERISALEEVSSAN